jgi:hypothetical protein
MTTKIIFTGDNPSVEPPKRVCIDGMTAAEIDKLLSDAVKRGEPIELHGEPSRPTATIIELAAHGKDRR